MLTELKISNLAIIKKLDMEFGSGFIVLTGETGAGKSIILNGLNLLLGEKASADMIRDGENELVAQGVFSVSDTHRAVISNALDELGIDMDESDDIIIRRTYDISGKGKAFVNNTRVTLASLKEVMTHLVDIVGQHSHQMLLNRNNHIKLLDRFLDDSANNVKSELANTYAKYTELTHKLQEQIDYGKEMADKQDFYAFQLNEIDEAHLTIGEDEELEAEYKKIFNAGLIREKVNIARNMLSDGEHNILHEFSVVMKNIENLCKFGKEYEEIHEGLQKIYYELQDQSDALNSIESESIGSDSDLADIAKRLEVIKKLKLKYGSTIAEILAYREDVDNKLSGIVHNDEQIEAIKKEIAETKATYDDLAEMLHEARLSKASEIESQMLAELRELSMENARFIIKVDLANKMTPVGSDDVEFYISTNLGQEPKPLAKIASGGEVSRIMLAIKVIFSKVDNIPTIIFDEIDTGVGGETVRRIATKLKQIGSNTQVISITHSPNIAAKANEQFFIKKEIIDNNTETQVVKLTYQERIDEISRMLAGENVTENVYQHAKDIIDEN